MEARQLESPEGAMKAPAGVTIESFEGRWPRLHPTVYLAEGVRIIGDVEIGAYSSVWYNAVIRGDVHEIRIGERTNIQDLCLLHVTHRRWPLVVGSRVTVGHSAVLHGCVIEDCVLVGMHATVLDGAYVEHHCLIGAGALVPPGMRVPAGHLVLGVPARVVRPLTEQERAELEQAAENYVRYAARYRAGS
ncbi:MAG: gamma carbonic anhydrase family protein [Bacteroidetes bacterium]|nr:gamma carbonic anhydrase family protein [Rhodothermia bacterium]MCX7906339.1 gamma carbonic anhydrase family protein [Bacteroidota bacterium]MDW8137415.1 gamma carbonic anhydrase family protein [Bacteroidota bacterium]MDW8285631.1 gamma carbonic anhydrase family protein [Bacteroidota bacterium]